MPDVRSLDQQTKKRMPLNANQIRADRRVWRNDETVVSDEEWEAICRSAHEAHKIYIKRFAARPLAQYQKIKRHLPDKSPDSEQEHESPLLYYLRTGRSDFWLSDNAVSWLSIVAQSTGLVAPADSPYRFEKLGKVAGIVPYPRNAMRHSFASYLLAKNQNAPLVAEQLGHTNLNTLYRNYRELVRPQEAKRYWQIIPVFSTGNIFVLEQKVA